MNINKSNKRAARREASQRIYRRRVSIATERGILWDGKSATGEQLFPAQSTHFLKDTATPCSCYLCRSQRKESGWKNSATRQELRFYSETVSEQVADALTDHFDIEWFDNNRPDQGEDELIERENVEGYVRGWWNDAAYGDDLGEDAYDSFYNDDRWYEDDGDDYFDSDEFEEDEIRWSAWFNDEREQDRLRDAWNNGISDPDHFTSKEEEIEFAYFLWREER